MFNIFFFIENYAVCELMSKIMVEPEVPQMTSKRFWTVFQSENRDVQHCGDAAQTG
jgi:hypothetical protein